MRNQSCVVGEKDEVCRVQLEGGERGDGRGDRESREERSETENDADRFGHDEAVDVVSDRASAMAAEGHKRVVGEAGPKENLRDEERREVLRLASKNADGESSGRGEEDE